MVERIQEGQKAIIRNLILYVCVVILTIGVIFITRNFVPYGSEILGINIIYWGIFVHWKPYQWHKNNPSSQLIFKEHGIDNFTWNNVRKYIFDSKYFLVNGNSIARFNYMDSKNHILAKY